MPGTPIVKNVSTNDEVFSKMKGFLKLEFINVHKKKTKIGTNISCTKIRFAQKISELRHKSILKETFLQFYCIQTKKLG